MVKGKVSRDRSQEHLQGTSKAKAAVCIARQCFDCIFTGFSPSAREAFASVY